LLYGTPKGIYFPSSRRTFPSVLPRRETTNGSRFYQRRQRAGPIFFNCGIGCWPRKPMSLLGQEHLAFKWRLLDNFRYAPGSDRDRGAAQYVAKGQYQKSPS
jgi:hypothetical protein